MNKAKPFMDQDFLLDTETSRVLFHEHARDCPIIDYHTHLPPQEVAGNSGFANLAQAWLGGDHYKWRAMRSNGIPEALVTGRRDSYEAYLAWAATMEALPGNPLFHWTHLELRRYFDCDLVLNRRNAPAIWEHCNKLLARDEFRVQGLMARMKVKVVCTTDDPLDDLEQHAAYDKNIAGRPEAPRMYPSFRPDKALAFGQTPDQIRAWLVWVSRLGEATGLKIDSLDRFCAALDQRHQYFHDQGCRLSDHGMTEVPGRIMIPAELDYAFAQACQGKPLSPVQVEALQTRMLAELSAMNRRRGWTMQLHFGALRSPNTRAFAALGPDTGFDAVTDAPFSRPLAVLLDACEQNGGLPRTILYTLNPGGNEALATLMGSFQDGTVPGKMQFGSAWWFNDHLGGMEKQLKDLASLGLLGRFVGMLTDSRSFLSFPRHEYFRRILCATLGRWVEDGLLPNDTAWLGGLVEDISFRNARDYFRFPE